MRTRIAALAAASLLGIACESPDEKPAQEMLEKAKTAKYRGDDTEAFLTAMKLERQYPKTKAAVEARKLSDEIATATKKANEEREARNRRVAAKIKQSSAELAKLHAQVDDMSQLTWYHDKAAKHWVLGKWIKAYFGVSEKDGSPALMPLRFKAQFEGSDWIFARTLAVKAGGKVYQLRPDDWKHSNYGGTVWEHCDVALSMENPDLLAALASAEDVKIRFEGRDTYSDFVVPKPQLDAFKRVHAIWKSFDDAGGAKP